MYFTRHLIRNLALVTKKDEDKKLTKKIEKLSGKGEITEIIEEPIAENGGRAATHHGTLNTSIFLINYVKIKSKKQE